MKFLGKIIFLPVAIAVVLFAIANRHEVDVSFWPLPFDAKTPLYVALLGALALGILIGAAASSVSVGKWRWRARKNAHRNSAPQPNPDILPAATGPVITQQPSTLPAIRRAALDDD
jgi:putative membrane protein